MSLKGCDYNTVCLRFTLFRITHKGSNFINLKMWVLWTKNWKYLLPEKRKQAWKNSIGEKVAYPIIGKKFISETASPIQYQTENRRTPLHVKSGRQPEKSHTAVNSTVRLIKLISLYTRITRIFSNVPELLPQPKWKTLFRVWRPHRKPCLACLRKWLQDFKARIGIDRAESTYEQHEILYRQLKYFLRERYNCRRYSFEWRWLYPLSKHWISISG